MGYYLLNKMGFSEYKKLNKYVQEGKDKQLYVEPNPDSYNSLYDHIYAETVKGNIEMAIFKQVEHNQSEITFTKEREFFYKTFNP